MDASVFLRKLNATDYNGLGKRKFSVLPRVNEFISTESEGSKKYFQVISVHHTSGEEAGVEIYAVETEPSWLVKKSRTIGFGS